jgi:hypothetical protein
LRRELAVNIRTPGLVNAAAEIAECTGWNSVEVENVPSGLVAGVAVAREAVKLAVWKDDLWRRKSAGRDGAHELYDWIAHGMALAAVCRVNQA